MKALLARIPVKLRRVFYALPFFVQWIIGLTWEEEASERRPARRAMVLALCFLLGISLLYMLRETLAYLTSGGLDFYVGWVVFALDLVLMVGYGLGSLYIIALELMNRSGSGWLDSLADVLERKLSV